MSEPDRLAEIRRQYKPGANQAVDHLLNRLTHRDLEIERLRGLLKRLEWAGARREEDACPACYEYKQQKQDQIGPHADGCWLAAELKGEP